MKDDHTCQGHHCLVCEMKQRFYRALIFISTSTLIVLVTAAVLVWTTRA